MASAPALFCEHKLVKFEHNLTFRSIVILHSLHEPICNAPELIQATTNTKTIKNVAIQHIMNQLALVNHNGNMDNDMSHPMAPAGGYDPKVTPMSIATISSGFEKGDFLVREEKGQRVVS